LHFADKPVKVHYQGWRFLHGQASEQEVRMDTRDSVSNDLPGGSQMTPRVAARPRHVSVSYRGMPYTLDLAKCRRALVYRQVEGHLDSIESLAAAVGISRSTASRFFSGRATSLAVTLKILKALRLKFEDVARPVGDRVR